MDRRSFLFGLAGAFAASAIVGGSGAAQALPLTPRPDLPPDPVAPAPAVATEADLEAAKAQEAYWVVVRRRRRRYYYRRRRYYYRRRRYYYRRRRYRRRRYRRYFY